EYFGSPFEMAFSRMKHMLKKGGTGISQAFRKYVLDHFSIEQEIQLQELSLRQNITANEYFGTHFATEADMVASLTSFKGTSFAAHRDGFCDHCEPIRHLLAM